MQDTETTAGRQPNPESERCRRDGTKTMQNETGITETTSAAGAAQQFLAGLAVWIIFMAAYAVT